MVLCVKVVYYDRNIGCWRGRRVIIIFAHNVCALHDFNTIIELSPINN